MLTNDPLRAINVTSTSGGQHNILCLLVGNIEPGYHPPHEAVETVLHVVGYGRLYVNGAHEDWIECIRNGGPVPSVEDEE